MTNDLAVIVEGCVSIAACGGFMGAVRAFQRHSRDHDQTHQTLQAMDERMERVEAEFWPNGGTSSRDLLDDLMADVRRIADGQGVALPPRRSRPKPGRKP